MFLRQATGMYLRPSCKPFSEADSIRQRALRPRLNLVPLGTNHLSLFTESLPSARRSHDNSGPSPIRITVAQAKRPLDPSSPVLQVRGLCKKYGALAAVDGVSFEVRSNEIVGLLGP